MKFYKVIPFIIIPDAKIINMIVVDGNICPDIQEFQTLPTDSIIRAGSYAGTVAHLSAREEGIIVQPPAWMSSTGTIRGGLCEEMCFAGTGTDAVYAIKGSGNASLMWII